MSDAHTERRALLWLNQLADLVRHGEDKPTADKLALYAALLAKELPGGAFTSDSLHEAGSAWTFFPPFADVRKHLLRWWDEHKPRLATALESPVAMGPDALDATDRAWLAYWHTRSAEIGQCTASRGARDMGLERVASLVRAQSPRAWELIARERSHLRVVGGTEG